MFTWPSVSTPEDKSKLSPLQQSVSFPFFPPCCPTCNSPGHTCSLQAPPCYRLLCARARNRPPPSGSPNALPTATAQLRASMKRQLQAARPPCLPCMVVATSSSRHLVAV